MWRGCVRLAGLLVAGLRRVSGGVVEVYVSQFVAQFSVFRHEDPIRMRLFNQASRRKLPQSIKPAMGIGMNVTGQYCFHG